MSYTIWNKVDWLTISFKYENMPYKAPIDLIDAREIARYIQLEMGMPGHQYPFNASARLPGYEYSFGDTSGAYICVSNRPEQGCAVVIPGVPMMEQNVEKVSGLTEKLKGQYTRVDYAVDVIGKDVPFKELVEVAQDYAVTRNLKFIKYYNGEACTGISVGSRQSEYYIRVYDKATEQDIDDDEWVRLECEMKFKRARREDMTLQDFIRTGNYALHRMVTASAFEELDLIATALEGGKVAPTMARPVSNRERWLNAVVLPSLETFYSENPEAFLVFLNSVLNIPLLSHSDDGT